MALPVLRNFYYIDARALDEYLVAIDGALYEDTITESEKSHIGGNLGGGIAVIRGEAEIAREGGKEVTRKVTLTYPAKFHRLYAALQKDGDLPFYQTMTPELWSTIDRNTLLEAAVNVQTSRLQSTLAAAAQLRPLMDAESSITGQFSDSASQRAFAGITALGVAANQRGIPFALHFTEECEYRLVGTLNPDNLLVQIDRVQGEFSALVKVQRLLRKSERFPLTNLMPDIEKLAANREQRRQMREKRLPPELDETVKGPAAVVIPIAFYV